MGLQFTNMVNLDDIDVLYQLHLGKLKLQVGQWFRLNGVKGRLYSVDTIKQTLEAVFVSDFNRHPFFNRKYELKDKRIKLEPYLGQSLVFQGRVEKVDNGICTFSEIEFSWGEKISDHVNSRVVSKSVGSLLSSMKGKTVVFYGTVTKYPQHVGNELRYGINEVRFSKE